MAATYSWRLQIRCSTFADFRSVIKLKMGDVAVLYMSKAACSVKLLTNAISGAVFALLYLDTLRAVNRRIHDN